MEEMWQILGISPSKDPKEVRRAYAKASKKIHPEEDPEGFSKLKLAYEQAMKAIAQENSGGSWYKISGKKAEVKKDALLYQFHKGTIIRQSPGFTDFCRLYSLDSPTSRERWVEYFISTGFLDIFLEAEFLEEVAIVVQERGQDTRFLELLYLVYQLMPLEEGKEAITPPNNGLYHLDLCLTEISPAVFLPLSNWSKLFQEAFADYYKLCKVVPENDDWAMEAVLFHYNLLYMKNKQKIEEKEGRLYQTLPVLAHFLQKYDMTDRQMKIFSMVLNLENKALWTAHDRMLFQPLFRVFHQKYPGFLEGEEHYWRGFQDSFRMILRRVEYLSTGEQLRLVGQYFANAKTLEEALCDQAFVESYFLQSMLSQTKSSVFLAKILSLLEKLDQGQGEIASVVVDRLWELEELNQCVEEDREKIDKTQAIRHHLYLSFPALHPWMAEHFPLDFGWVREKFSQNEQKSGTVGDFSYLQGAFHRQYWRGTEAVWHKQYHFSQVKGESVAEFLLYLPLIYFLPQEKSQAKAFLLEEFRRYDPQYHWEKLVHLLLTQMEVPVTAEGEPICKQNLQHSFALGGYIYDWMIKAVPGQENVYDISLDRLLYAELGGKNLGVYQWQGELSFLLPLLDEYASPNISDWDSLPEPDEMVLEVAGRKVTKKEFLPYSLLETYFWASHIQAAYLCWGNVGFQFFFQGDNSACVLLKAQRIYLLDGENMWQESKNVPQSFAEFGENFQHRLVQMSQLRKIIMFTLASNEDREEGGKP